MTNKYKCCIVDKATAKIKLTKKLAFFLHFNKILLLLNQLQYQYKNHA